MKIGFYAPLKSPDHPTPSGDRKIARMLFKALNELGHEVVELSTLRSWEGKGDLKVQKEIEKSARQEVDNLFRENIVSGLQVVFVYHVYHKAPDWIGLAVATELNIPYVVVEASYAPKQSYGKWQEGHAQTKQCIENAEVLICINPQDVPCVRAICTDHQHIVESPPFAELSQVNLLTREELVETAGVSCLNKNNTWLICVAMMRKGDKFKSYTALAEALEFISGENWNLVVIGDGEQREEVEQLFTNVAQHCVFLGQQSEDKIVQWLYESDVYVWPSINEAFGLAILEAVGCGLPTLSYDYGGVGSIVENGVNGFLVNAKNSIEYGHKLAQLVQDRSLRIELAANARKKFEREHDYSAFRLRLSKILEGLSKTKP